MHAPVVQQKHTSSEYGHWNGRTAVEVTMKEVGTAMQSFRSVYGVMPWRCAPVHAPPPGASSTDTLAVGDEMGLNAMRLESTGILPIHNVQCIDERHPFKLPCIRMGESVLMFSL